MRIIVYTLIISGIFSSCSSPNNCMGEKINDCVCTREYRPVCGCNDITFSNKCEAKCAGVKNFKEGSCSEKSNK
jgi:hypothetical protein